MNILALRKEQLEAARQIYKQIEAGTRHINFCAPPRWGTSTMIETCVGAWRHPGSNDKPLIVHTDQYLSSAFRKQYSDSHAIHVAPGVPCHGLFSDLVIVDLGGVVSEPGRAFYDWFNDELAPRAVGATLVVAAGADTPILVYSRLSFPDMKPAFIQAES